MVVTVLRGILVSAMLQGVTQVGLPGQDTQSRDAITEDLRYFLAQLEQIHPDPYTAFGGKIEFKRRAQDMVALVPDRGMAASGICDLLAPFLAELGDGHTGITCPKTDSEVNPKRVLPLEFGVATDAVFVTRAAIGFEDLVGLRLVSADGQSVGVLKSRASQILTSENEFGSARALTRTIETARNAQRLFGHALDSLELRLIDLEGAEVSRRVEYEAPDRWNYRDETSDTFGFPAGEDEPIWWSLLESSRAGYLRLHAIVGRESFEQARGRQDLPDYVASYYARYRERAAPEDLDSALEGIPCFTRTVVELLTAMHDRGSRYLIVDVRSNGGGWSSLMLPLYLLTYGDVYLDFPFPETWVDVASPQLLKLNGWTPADLEREWGSEFGVGDYRFSVMGSPRGSASPHEYIEGLESFSCGLAQRAAALEGLPLYEPKVVVLTDSGTFSAAFQLAYHLWYLGATVVGTPSAQSGNAYTNVMPIVLPNSGLKGSIARSAQLFFPGDDELGSALIPDFPMTWQHFARFGFDADSELLYALELIAAGDVDAARIRPR